MTISLGQNGRTVTRRNTKNGVGMMSVLKLRYWIRRSLGKNACERKKKDPRAWFVPSGEVFHFEPVYARYNFADDLLDIDFRLYLPVDSDQVDLSSSVNSADQWNAKKIAPAMCPPLMHA